MGIKKRKGGIVLLVSSVIAKALGVFYRIPLFYVLSTESVGIYQLVFPLYAFIIALVSGGLPVSVCKTTSELYSENKVEDAEKTTDKALVFFSCISFLFSLVLLLFPSCVSAFLGNMQAKNSIITIAPSIVFACIIATLRGYFQANSKWGIVGISYILEQAIKCVGIVIVLLSVKSGVVGAILGVTIGEGVTALIMLICYAKNRQTRFSFSFLPSKTFVFFCLSVSIGLIAMPLNSFVDGFAVVTLLSKSIEVKDATSLYGIMSGAVSPLIAVPFVITSSFTAFLLPQLCKIKKEERSRLFNEKCKLMILFASFFFLAFFIFAPIIVKVLFPSLNEREYLVCVSLLKTASPIVLLSSLLALITTFLQSVNKPFLPAIILLFSVGVKCLILPFCIRNASIYGAQIANVTVYVVAFFTSCFFACKKGFSFSIKTFSLLCLSVLLFAFLLFACYSLLPTVVGCVIAFVVASSLSLVFCSSFKAVTIGWIKSKK